MEIKFNEEGGYTLVQTTESYPKPKDIAVSWEDIFEVINSSTSLCLDDQEDREQLMKNLIERAYEII